jgi:hypothetical protein
MVAGDISILRRQDQSQQEQGTGGQKKDQLKAAVAEERQEQADNECDARQAR